MTDRIRHPRYVLFLLAFVLASLLASIVLPLKIAIVAGFDVAVLVFILSCVRLWRCGDPEIMRRQAKRDDANQLLLLLLSGLISVIILAAITTLLLDKDNLTAAEAVLVVTTLLSSWVFTNLVLTFHYARLFYSSDGDTGGDRGGLDFPGKGDPDFSDFVNFSFVVGMTCQTADIAITGRAMRRVSTFHGLFAFAFNLGVLALVVNVLASATN